MASSALAQANYLRSSAGTRRWDKQDCWSGSRRHRSKVEGPMSSRLDARVAAASKLLSQARKLHWRWRCLCLDVEHWSRLLLRHRWWIQTQLARRSQDRLLLKSAHSWCLSDYRSWSRSVAKSRLSWARWRTASSRIRRAGKPSLSAATSHSQCWLMGSCL